MAAIHSYPNRLVNLPLQQANSQKESNIIYQIPNMNALIDNKG